MFDTNKDGVITESEAINIMNNLLQPNNEYDLKRELNKNDKLFITTSGTILKVRSQYGERICQLSISKAKNPKDTYMGQISVLYKLSKLYKVEIVNKVAPGIGYEKMQI